MERPTLPARTATLNRFVRAVVRRVEVDLRALAAFRVAVGALVIVDLALRSRDLVAFYTDDGVLPREALFADSGTVYSLHALSGEAWAQVLLFVLAGTVALAMVVGYRTRLATAVSWVLLVSLHVRNPMVLNSGDVLLRMLLFWGIFLPLGERWAVDAARRNRTLERSTAVHRNRARERTAVASIATAALLLQVVLVYATNAVHKSQNDEWMAGTAVAYIFQADHFTILLGDVLAEYTSLLEVFTVLWLALVFASPLLLLLTGIPRAVLASAFAGMHFGMALTLRIDLFPLIVVAGLLPFYPPVVWDAAAALASRTGLPSIIRPRAGRIAAFRSVPGAAVPLSGRSVSPGLRRAVAGACTGCLSAVPAVFLALVLTSNVAAVTSAEVPEPADEGLDAVQAHQSWRMFAPTPTRTTKWFAAPGTLDNGTTVDVLHGSDVDLDRPPNVDGTYPTSRWRKYLSNVQSANEIHRSAFSNYLCDRWNRGHATDVSEVTVYYLYERTDPYTGSAESGEQEVHEYDCSGDLIQDGDLPYTAGDG